MNRYRQRDALLCFTAARERRAFHSLLLSLEHGLREFLGRNVVHVPARPFHGPLEWRIRLIFGRKYPGDVRMTPWHLRRNKVSSHPRRNERFHCIRAIGYCGLPREWNIQDRQRAPQGS